MKSASASFIALLASNQFVLADCYAFALVGGGVLRYTSFDTDVVLDGNTYAAGAPDGPWVDAENNRARVTQRLGLQVDDLSFTILPGSATVGGFPFLTACRLGLFDGADLTLHRAIMAATGTGILPRLQASAGAIVWFAGRVAQIEVGRSAARFRVASHVELLNQNLPRNLYQAGCVNTLGDQACGVNLGALAVAVTALSGSTAALINVTSAQPSGYFGQGKATFTAGANAGLWRLISRHVSGSPAQLTVVPAFPAAPQIGDGLTIYPGCNKSLTDSNGCPKFANQARFRGTPFVPVAETAV